MGKKIIVGVAPIVLILAAVCAPNIFKSVVNGIAQLYIGFIEFFTNVMNWIF